VFQSLQKALDQLAEVGGHPGLRGADERQQQPQHRLLGVGGEHLRGRDLAFEEALDLLAEH
jgi:hypothetical protein